jgi:hypothetical protein
MEAGISKSVEFAAEGNNGEISQKEIFENFPHLLPETVVRFVEKHSKKLTIISIGGILCFKTIESINSNLPNNFRAILDSIVNKLIEFDIERNENSLNVALSFNYGYNFRMEHGLEKSELFQKTISENIGSKEKQIFEKPSKMTRKKRGGNV